MNKKMGKLRIIYGSFGSENSRRDVEFLSNSLMALGIDEIFLKVPPSRGEKIPVDGSLRFRLFGAIIGGNLIEITIEAPLEILGYLEEELGSGLNSAIITIETTSSVAFN